MTEGERIQQPLFPRSLPSEVELSCWRQVPMAWRVNLTLEPRVRASVLLWRQRAEARDHRRAETEQRPGETARRTPGRASGGGTVPGGPGAEGAARGPRSPRYRAGTAAGGSATGRRRPASARQTRSSWGNGAGEAGGEGGRGPAPGGGGASRPHGGTSEVRRAGPRLGSAPAQPRGGRRGLPRRRTAGGEGKNPLGGGRAALPGSGEGEGAASRPRRSGSPGFPALPRQRRSRPGTTRVGFVRQKSARRASQAWATKAGGPGGIRHPVRVGGREKRAPASERGGQTGPGPRRGRGYAHVGIFGMGEKGNKKKSSFKRERPFHAPHGNGAGGSVAAAAPEQGLPPPHGRPGARGVLPTSTRHR